MVCAVVTEALFSERVVLANVATLTLGLCVSKVYSLWTLLHLEPNVEKTDYLEFVD